MYFSIVIPVFNRAAEIAETLASVQDQTFTDFECIVVDDGSDDSEALRARVDSLGDERFSYVRQANAGGGAARNAGIRAARGVYIAFLDSDDLFLPNKLEVAKSHIEGFNSSALYSRALVDRGVEGRMWIRPERPIRAEEDMGEYLFVSNQFVQTSTIVMATSVARQVMFDPALRKGQDLDFCVRAHSMGVRFHMIEDALVIWRDTSEIGRTSRHSGARAPIDWLQRSKGFLTRRAELGYRATVLAYYRPKWQVLTVLWDLVVGMVAAGVPANVAGRQFLRFALPRMVYRRLVNLAVGMRGKPT